VSKATTVRLVWYHTRVYAQGNILPGLLIGLLAMIACYELRIFNRKELFFSSLALVVANLAFVIAVALFKALRWRNLPRRLTRRQKKRITEYLEKYKGDGRIVQIKICYHPDREIETEAQDYAEDIISVIRQSGWRVDVGEQEARDESEHSLGLWVYGLNQRGLAEPLTRAIIATAFNKASVEMNEDREITMEWTFIVVGHKAKGGAQ
jgi:hypothetical protein